MPGETRFLSIDDILRLHALAIEDQGGDPSLRDRGLLESATAMPRQQFGGEYLHPDIPSQAAAYCFHICKNHAFIDGNKRAATAAMIAFLSDNGWAFDADADKAEPVILRLASGEMTKDELTAWVKANCHEKMRIELRDFFAALSPEKLLNAGDLFHEKQGARPVEFLAALQDARDAIPAAGAMWDVYHELTQSGKSPTELRGLGDQIKTFLALYRIAEDMGYEW